MENFLSGPRGKMSSISNLQIKSPALSLTTPCVCVAATKAPLCFTAERKKEPYFIRIFGSAGFLFAICLLSKGFLYIRLLSDRTDNLLRRECVCSVLQLITWRGIWGGRIFLWFDSSPLLAIRPASLVCDAADSVCDSTSLGPVQPWIEHVCALSLHIPHISLVLMRAPKPLPSRLPDVNAANPPLLHLSAHNRACCLAIHRTTEHY